MSLIRSSSPAGSGDGFATALSAALVPVLLGLSAPAVIVAFAKPDLLANTGVVFAAYMSAIFICASVAFFAALAEKSDVVGFRVVDWQKKVVIQTKGLIADRERGIAFGDIAAVRMATRQSKDGYETAVPVLALKSGETVLLPAGTTESDIAMLRDALQRGRSQRRGFGARSAA